MSKPMNRVKISEIFADSIFPCFPFSNKQWLAIAFERDNYDNTRMPEWFFRAASEEFPGESAMLIKGFGGKFDSLPDGLVEIPFNWEEYRKFMLSNEGYSPEYQMVGPGASWACWADPELTVWGGEASRMDRIFDRYGGKEKALEFMKKDFYLIQEGRNPEMHAYLHSLVFRHIQN